MWVVLQLTLSDFAEATPQDTGALWLRLRAAEETPWMRT